ncbi:hypothetical protein JVU11DRAFT_6155 [Chiua virens]|nr:hypothetical protein JVU11DRAFT_6155 [Chiua virens]
MRRLLGLKDSNNSKSKEHQRLDPTSTSVPLPDPSSSNMPMEVHVSTEIHSALDRRGFHPLASTTSLESSSPASSDSHPLPPEIRVPTHPYPYWQGYAHTPSSTSSQSSLESPATPSHVSWLNLPSTTSASNAASSGTNINNNPGLTIPTSVPQNSAGPSSSTHSLVHGRSSPDPNFPPPPPTNPPPNLSISTRPNLGRVYSNKSVHSLRPPVQEYFNQPLSPIVEQDYFSPEKRPSSLPSLSHEGGSRSSTAHTRTSAALVTPISPGSGEFGTATVTPVSPVPITSVLVSARGTPSTPHAQAQNQTPVTPSYPAGTMPFPFLKRKEEDGNDSPRPSPISTFILRPLNRSISVSSTRTHQSTSSATPPVIPPLDLRPEFRGQTLLTTPTSLHARGFLDVGGAREDDSGSDRRDSFVTARTGIGRESRHSIGQSEVFVDAEEGFICDTDGTVHQFNSRVLDDNGDTPTASHPQPLPQSSGASKSIKPPIPARTMMHLRSLEPPHPHRSIPPPSLHPSRPAVSAPSLGELGASYVRILVIHRPTFRALLVVSPPRFGTRDADVTDPGGRCTLIAVDTVQVLFWVGFIAPWCWLIGGWLISAKPPSRGYGPGHSVSGAGRSSASVYRPKRSTDGQRNSLHPSLGDE